MVLGFQGKPAGISTSASASMRPSANLAAFYEASARAASSLRTVNVAGFLVNSTQSTCQPFKWFFVRHRRVLPRVVGGGSARRRLYSRTDIESVFRGDGQDPVVTHAQYELLEVRPANWEDQEHEGPPGGTITVRMPIAMLIPKLDVPSLKDLCLIHKIPTTCRNVRVQLEKSLRNHNCTELCEDSVAILNPVDTGPTIGTLDLQSPAFAASQIKPMSIDLLRPHLSAAQASTTATVFRVKQVSLDVDAHTDPDDFIIQDLPLVSLLPLCSVPAMHTFASHHGVRMLKRWSKKQCHDALKDHGCTSCRTLFFIITPILATKRRRAPPSWIDDGATPFLWESSVSMNSVHYPPQPTTMHDIATAMKDYCSELRPEVIEEAGCCVCAQLTPRTQLLQYDAAVYDLSILEELSCTRLERLNTRQPVRQVDGPVVDASLPQICVQCDGSLKRGQRPKTALANHLWVGDVPDCLKDLTLAEMAMVTRVRYNRCVVRISSGHAKMTANVIAFEHPTMKIYQRLPMNRGELEDVLAVLYTGMEPPSDDDLRRSPVLVRRKTVKTALEWLKANHKDYGDLDIDYEVLSSYPLEDVPVGVYYKNLAADEGNVPAAAKSVFDNTPEEGTSTGPCPYTVHGLTAERFTSMTTTQRNLAAVQQLKNGGKLLAVGYDKTPQSLFSNPKLYPSMFPWLFPYGHGGLDLDEHAGKISRDYHIKWLLMYYDKRFQRDANFLIVLFNHQLIRQSSNGTFMMAKRNNFAKMVDTVHQLDPGVLKIISDRLINGGRASPQTPEEQKAFRIFDQIEYVGNSVAGSMSRKKYQRGEVWSLINFMNTPAWFITIAPADNKHPLCIHWAGNDTTFKPEIKGYAQRKHLITRNPVACARFFHHLVQLFIKHICGWTADGPKRGLFGMPAAFYGTVEQQGRMTLHLHFLLWIQGQLSLNEIREKLTQDSDFVREITEYIESCMVGGFSTGTKDEVEARVPRHEDYDDRGIHTILQPTAPNAPADYVDPTLTLPEPPPDRFCDDVELCACENCVECRAWYERFKLTLDDIILRSNVHQCFDRLETEEKSADATEGASSTPGADSGQQTVVNFQAKTKKVKSVKTSLKTAKVAKASSKRKGRRHATAKGCINKHGRCAARFPREVFMRTTVDPKTGHLNAKHTDSSVNDVSPAVTYGNRCNTDSTFLLSGTAVKATVGYVMDYITKAWLKTYQVFSSMYDTFTRYGGMLDDSNGNAAHSTRQMILKVVNSLSSKMEIGAPMAALYLLGNPDHYTSHTFVVFYWKNYVNFVQGEWKALDTLLEPCVDLNLPSEGVHDVGVSRSTCPPTTQVTEDIEPSRDDPDDSHAPLHDLQADLIEDVNQDDEVEQTRSAVNALPGTREDETVTLTREGNVYMAKSNTDDYRFRPRELEDVCLYEFIQCAVKHPMRSTRAPRKDLRFFRLQEDHPQSESHVMACDPDRRWTMVPNFLGPRLPRKDVGDRETYCCTMLTLFKPWRTGIDLKGADVTWETTFDNHPFTKRALELMENFNVRYECYDARDDYAAMSKVVGFPSDGPYDDVDDDESVYADDGDFDDYFGEDDEDLSAGVGPATQGIQDANTTMFKALRRAGWNAWNALSNTSAVQLGLPKIAIDDTLHSAAWRNIVKVAKARAWRRKVSAMGASEDSDIPKDGVVRNDAFVVPSTYLSKDFQPTEAVWSEVMHRVIDDFTLNEGQEKAFRIVANHACEIAPEQLLMHLGGMAGTGKSTVIRALTAFFNARKEPYRFVLLGPTGTSAALIGGSTYHSFLGLNTGSSSSRTSISAMEEVKERLTGVGYILIDEQSMLNCRQLCAISARCCDALGVYERPFGGLNVILCGDFAQLPPAKGKSLYSRDVSLRQSPRQHVSEQENTIGKLTWLQFTMVVVLTQNMRQIDNLPEELAFQKALLNLRWHACTDEDIALFKSRIANTNDDRSLDAEGFKNVSIITARNRDKDHLNAANSTRFSGETGQELHDFYSVDTMLSAPAKRDSFNQTRIYSTAKTLSKKMQSALWQQPPCTSENIPGKLSLSIGMPILIRHNEATELCMTRGQEGRVVGWTSVRHPKFPQRRSLDVLYVELIKPPHPVKLPHLPKNVVPLTKNSQPVDGRLMNDEWVHISRAQVPVLPNFAMTDYSSQGKTREWNVVDLTECRNFQAAYTCLSRGTRISQTLILRDFNERKLKGELDGELRQEYRELDCLATITDLRYLGVLNIKTLEATRWTVMDAYKAWKDGPGKTLSSAASPDLPSPSTSVREYPVYDVNTLHSQSKRKASEAVNGQPVKKKRRGTKSTMLSSVWESPAGPLWDHRDHSCAFDAWVFVVHTLWTTDKARWSKPMPKYGSFFKHLVQEFEGMLMEDPEVELTAVRDSFRQCLRRTYPQDYPQGNEGVDILTLASHLLNDSVYKPLSPGLCDLCSAKDMLSSAVHHISRRLTALETHSSVQGFVEAKWGSKALCTSCGVVALGTVTDICELVTFHISCESNIESRIEIGDWGTYRIAGVIYYDAVNKHFLARSVKLDNKVYSHDGMNGTYSDYEGLLDVSFPSSDLGNLHGTRATLAVYAIVNRRPARH